jgi:methionine-gamma-lyase
MKTSSKNFATRAIHHGYDPHGHRGRADAAAAPDLDLRLRERRSRRRDVCGRAAGPYLFAHFQSDARPAGTAHCGAGRRRGRACAGFRHGRDHRVPCGRCLSPGDEVIVDKTLYGCTFAFMHHGLRKFGITITHVDMTDPANLEAVISAQDRVVYFETPANPNMRLVDIEAISKSPIQAVRRWSSTTPMPPPT